MSDYTYLVSPEFTTGNIPDGYTFGENAFKELVYATNATLANPTATVYVYGGSQGANDAVYKNAGKLTVSDISYLTGETVSTAVTAYTFENNTGASVTTDGNVSFTILNKLTNAGSFTLGSEASLVATKENTNAADVVVENSGTFTLNGASFTADLVDNDGTFNINTGSTINATFSGNDGTINLNGNLTGISIKRGAEADGWNNVVFPTASASTTLASSTIEAGTMTLNRALRLQGNTTITAKEVNFGGADLVFVVEAGANTILADSTNAPTSGMYHGVRIRNGELANSKVLGAYVEVDFKYNPSAWDATISGSGEFTGVISRTIAGSSFVNKLTITDTDDTTTEAKEVVSISDVLQVGYSTTQKGSLILSNANVSVHNSGNNARFEVNGSDSTVTVTNSTVAADTIAFSNGATLSMNFDSDITAGSVTGAGSIAVTGAAQKKVLVKGNIDAGINLTVAGVAISKTAATDLGNNMYATTLGSTGLFVTDESQATLYVGSAYAEAGVQKTGEFVNGHLVGYNAFSNIVGALTEAQPLEIANGITISLEGATTVSGQGNLFYGAAFKSSTTITAAAAQTVEIGFNDDDLGLFLMAAKDKTFTVGPNVTIKTTGGANRDSGAVYLNYFSSDAADADKKYGTLTVSGNIEAAGHIKFFGAATVTGNLTAGGVPGEEETWADVADADKRLIYLAAGRANKSTATANESVTINGSELNAAWFQFGSGDADVKNATVNAETFIYTNTTGEPGTAANISDLEYAGGKATLTSTDTTWDVDYFEAFRDLKGNVSGVLNFKDGAVTVNADTGRNVGGYNSPYAAEIGAPVIVNLTNGAAFNVANGTLSNAGTINIGNDADDNGTPDDPTDDIAASSATLTAKKFVNTNTGTINLSGANSKLETTDSEISSEARGAISVTNGATLNAKLNVYTNSITVDSATLKGYYLLNGYVMTVSGDSKLEFTFSNGRVTLLDGTTLTDASVGLSDAGAVLRVAAGRAVEFKTSDNGVSRVIGNGVISNAGTITVSGDLTTGAITNEGSITINAGAKLTATSIDGGRIILKDIAGMDGVVVSTTTGTITSDVYYQIGEGEPVKITEGFPFHVPGTNYVISKTDKTISVAVDPGQSVLYVADTADKLPEGTVLGYNGFTSFAGALAAAQENALPDTTITVLSDITEAPTGNLFASGLFDGNVTINGKLVEDSTTHELRNPIVTVNLGTTNEFDPTPADNYEFIFSAGNSDDETVGIDFVMESGTFWPNEHPTTPSKATFTISNNVTAQGIVFKKGITNVTSTGTLKATGIPNTTDLGNITFYTDDLVFSVDGENGGFTVAKPQVTAGGSLIFRKGMVEFDNTFVSAKYLAVTNDYAGEMEGSVNLTSDNTTWTVTGDAFVKFYTGSTFGDGYTADFTFTDSKLDIAGSFVNVAHETSNGVNDLGVFEGAPAINLNLTDSILIAKSVTNDGPGSITVAGESTVKIGKIEEEVLVGGLVGSINVADGAELSATTAIYDLAGDETVATVNFDAKTNGSGITVAAGAVIKTNIKNSNADLKFNGALNTGNGGITNNAGAKITMVGDTSSITGASISNSGAIYAKAVTTTGAGGIGINNGTTTSLISATSITAENGGEIINKGTIGTGQTAPNYGIQLTGDLTATTSTITNGVTSTTPVLPADKAIIKAANITADNITNYGVIDVQVGSNTTNAITLTGALTNGEYGNIFADELKAASIDNSNEILVNKITVSGLIDNNAGAAIALNEGEGFITIQAGTISNSGYIKTLTGGSITVGGALVNEAYEEYEFEESEDKPLALAKGLIWTDSISAGSISNDGKIVVATTITAGSISNKATGVIEAGTITTTTGNVSNAGTIGDTTSYVAIDATGNTVSNTGTIYADTLKAAQVRITEGTVNVNTSVTASSFIFVKSPAKLNVNGASLDNQTLDIRGGIVNVYDTSSLKNVTIERLGNPTGGSVNLIGATLTDTSISNITGTQAFNGSFNVTVEDEKKLTTLKGNSAFTGFTVNVKAGATLSANALTSDEDENYYTSTFGGLRIEDGATLEFKAQKTVYGLGPSLVVDGDFNNAGKIVIDATGLEWGSSLSPDPIQVISVTGNITSNTNIEVVTNDPDNMAVAFVQGDGVYLYKTSGGDTDLKTIVVSSAWADPTVYTPGKQVTFGEDEAGDPKTYVIGVNAFATAPTNLSSLTEEIQFATLGTTTYSYGDLTLTNSVNISVWSANGLDKGGTIKFNNVTVNGAGADKTRINIGEETVNSQITINGNLMITAADVDFDDAGTTITGYVGIEGNSEVEFDRTTTIDGALIVTAGSQVEANQGKTFIVNSANLEANISEIFGTLYVNTDDDEDVITGTTASLGTIIGSGEIYTDVNSVLDFTSATGDNTFTGKTHIDVTGLEAAAAEADKKSFGILKIADDAHQILVSGDNVDTATPYTKYFVYDADGGLVQADKACNVIKVTDTAEIKDAVGGVTGEHAYTWGGNPLEEIPDPYYADVVEVNVGAGTISKNTYFMANPTMVGGNKGQQIVINSGTFNKNPVAAGTKIVPADPDVPETFDGTKEIKLTINGGTFSKHVNGADVVTQAGWVIRKADTYLTINGGTFGVDGGLVAAGMVYATNDVTSLIRLAGSTNLTITGGTFLTTVYGGNLSYYKTGSQCTQITGNANVTIEADWSSENNAKKITMANLILGSSGAGVIKGNTSLTLTGNGDNLSIESVWGGCGSDIYKKDDNRAYQTSMSATSERILTFEGFINTFDCKSIRGFSKVIVKSFQDDEDEDPIATNATLINTDEYGLADANNWEFELGSSLNGGFANDFAGDTLTLSGIAGIDGMGEGEDWLICSNIDFDKFAFEGIKSINGVTGSALVFEGNAYTFDYAENQYQLSFGEYTTKGNEPETFNAMYLTRLA